MSRDHIVIVGATGAVGREAIRILSQRGVPQDRIVALASERSAGTLLNIHPQPLTVSPLTTTSFDNAAVAIFCASADVSRTYAPIALAAGATVIDNSSAFRMDPLVPLIIPEINGASLFSGSNSSIAHRPAIIANPNCSTILLLMALEPLRARFGIEAIDVATYQAVSGAGAAAIDELLHQVQAHAQGTSITPEVFREPCAFNVFSHDTPTDPHSGVNGEERKMIDESRKIWSDSSIRITPTCIRVPVVRAHTQAITVTLKSSAKESQVRAALLAGRGVHIIDDRASNSFPTPLKAADIDHVLVGRIRPDPCDPALHSGQSKRWCLIASMDQLRKGAALNAIQIAEHLLPRIMSGTSRAERTTPVPA